MKEIDSASLKTQPKRQRSIVHDKSVFLLNKHAVKSSGGYVSLPESRRVFSWLLHLSKEEVYQFLRELQDAGLISKINSHGFQIIKRQEGGN